MLATLNTLTRAEIGFRFGDADLVADAAGVLLWPDEQTLIVADLHFEKGSALTARGRGVLPPFDTAETLRRLAAVIGRRRPRCVLCLGDSFHDAKAGERLADDDRRMLHALASDRDWIWATGNHDADLPSGLPGRVVAEWRHAGLLFRHQADTIGAAEFEISGHYHPKTTIMTAARAMRRPCFVYDSRRLVLPAFGAYTGGLDICESVIANLFDSPPIRLVMGRGSLHAFPPQATRQSGGKILARHS